jgi:hypothetical protein
MMTSKTVWLAIALALSLGSSAQAQSGFTTGTIADSASGGYSAGGLGPSPGGHGRALYAYAPRYQRHVRRVR